MIEYIKGGSELIDEIETMWNKLNSHHAKYSPYFSSEFESISYDKRKKAFYKDNKQLHIIIAKDSAKYIGYCAASFTDSKGEIESIYVDSNYRGQSIGHVLMEKSLKWLEKNNIENIEIFVAVGNESAYNFYSSFGFYPRVTKLVKK